MKRFGKRQFYINHKSDKTHNWERTTLQDRIEYVEFRLADIYGQLKGMTVPCEPAKSVEELLNDPIMEKGTSIDGSSIVGLSRVESSDIRLQPEPATAVELPYSDARTAAVMCFVREKMVQGREEEYYPKDTRGRLHQVCEDHLEDNMQLMVKTEPEFYALTPEGQPFDEGQYADIYPKSPTQSYLLSLSNALRFVGMDLRVIHHEVGSAQQEIEISYSDARHMADTLLLFKNLTRAVALEQGIDVTFMPKPFEGEAGNGLHCHLQLWEGGDNLFGSDDSGSLSETAKMFVAGLLEHAPAITAIANPTVNSYKRLVPHQEAPVYISWGDRNRTALIRIPLFKDKSDAAIEFRSPDPSTNPYLLFSAIIAAGMDGIEKELEAPTPVSRDVFRMSDAEREKIGIGSLPSTLGSALHHLEEDEVITQAIGDEIAEEFIALKRNEWLNYVNRSVTDFEWQHYRDV
jgi:glutamine synthetase